MAITNVYLSDSKKQNKEQTKNKTYILALTADSKNYRIVSYTYCGIQMLSIVSLICSIGLHSS